jgi:hypothetical protein
MLVKRGIIPPSDVTPPVRALNVKSAGEKIDGSML